MHLFAAMLLYTVVPVPVHDLDYASNSHSLSFITEGETAQRLVIIELLDADGLGRGEEGLDQHSLFGELRRFLGLFLIRFGEVVQEGLPLVEPELEMDCSQ